MRKQLTVMVKGGEREREREREDERVIKKLTGRNPRQETEGRNKS